MPTPNCKARTLEGNFCSRKAVRFNKLVNKDLCSMHNEKCNFDFKYYHDICDKVWKIKCDKNTSNKDVNNIEKAAASCKLLREDFTKNYNYTLDESHFSAISKMEKKITQCQTERTKRINELFGN